MFRRPFAGCTTERALVCSSSTIELLAVLETGFKGRETPKIDLHGPTAFFGQGRQRRGVEPGR